MAIDINALAESAFELAKALTPQAFRSIQLQLSPTPGAYNPVTDQPASTVWGFDSGVAAFKAMPYDDEKERGDQPVETRLKVWMMSLDDITTTDDMDLDATGQITDASDTTDTIWQIYRTEVDPSKSIVLFYCRT